MEVGDVKTVKSKDRGDSRDLNAILSSGMRQGPGAPREAGTSQEDKNRTDVW